MSIEQAGQLALESLYAENRASAARLRACHALVELCVDEQLDREADPDQPCGSGAGASGGRPGGGRARPEHAVVDPVDIACAELVARYGVHHHRAAAMLALAVHLVDHLPAVLGAMETGRLDERTASMLARHLRTVDPRALPAVQSEVVAWLLDAIDSGARPGREAILARVDRIIGEHDPEGVRARRAEAVKERDVTVRRAPDGMADLTARLTAAEASAMYSALDRTASRTAADDLRGVGRHRADALVDAVLGLGPSGTLGGDPGGPHPGGSAPGGPHPGGSAPGGPHPGGSAPGGTSAPRLHVTVLAPSGPGSEPEVYVPRSGPAAVDTLIDLLSRSVGATIEPVDPRPGAADTRAGALRYRVGAELARRVRLRDGTCRHPGCSEPAERCDIDHVRPFDHTDPARGGPTTEGNLMCLCRRHHRFKTFHGWEYRLSPDGELVVRTTGGQVLRTHPIGPLSRWREWEEEASHGPPPAAAQDTAAPPDPDRRHWLHPGPRTTYWRRRAQSIAAERRRHQGRGGGGGGVRGDGSGRMGESGGAGTSGGAGAPDGIDDDAPPF